MVRNCGSARKEFEREMVKRGKRGNKKQKEKGKGAVYGDFARSGSVTKTSNWDWDRLFQNAQISAFLF